MDRKPSLSKTFVGRAFGRRFGMVRRAIETVLHAYSQILFCEHNVVGSLILAATLLDPVTGLSGLAAVIAASGFAHLMRFSGDVILTGFYGYNALLLGTAIGSHYAMGPRTAAVLGLASVGCVLVSAAVKSWFAASGLPMLTFPFLIVYYLMISSSKFMGLSFDAAPPLTAASAISGIGFIEGFFQSLGYIFYIPATLTGVIIAIGLVFYSRISTLIALLAYLAAWAVMNLTPAGEALGVGYLSVIAINLMFVGMAVSGVFFVPGVSSFLMAGLVGAVTVVLTLGLTPIMGAVGLPVLILPFNLGMAIFLFAMRQRVRDGSPKAVDFVPGTPEANLSYYRTRVARFGTNYSVRFQAPFMGKWTCTQSVDGPHTHQDLWKYALDFEVYSERGTPYATDGRDLKDYLCYKLPVLSPADGTVVRIVDGIRDNEIGEVNLADNWGNLILIYHAPYVYSLMCHIAPGSFRVREGQFVRTGEVVGLCGNSGRSPIPHLHFHLQALPRIGAATIFTELHNVVHLQGRAQNIRSTVVPEEGDCIRNFEITPRVADHFHFHPGRKWRFTAEDGREETIEHVIDLLGSFVMRSDAEAWLYCYPGDRSFTVFDVLGNSRSLLHIYRMALGHVPFELQSELPWTDYLPYRTIVPLWWRPVLDFVSPFVMRDGVQMRYQARFDGGKTLVVGESLWKRGKVPVVQTEATLESGSGVTRIEVAVGGKKTVFAIEQLASEYGR